MLDHVALLVERLEPALERLAPLDLPAGPIEDFPGEGTREVYLGEAGRPGRLLLMQALGDDGPYARALRKRGPGLHHVAVRVPDLDAFAAGLQDWQLHAICDRTRAHGTLWLYRPGVGTLVEVYGSAKAAAGAPLITAVEVPSTPPWRGAVEGLTGELRSTDGPARLRIGAEWVEAQLEG